MNKGQTAVPALILSTIVLLIIYLLWIYPQQRYELLGGPGIETTTPAERGFYSAFIGEIGQSSGQLLETQMVPNITVRYPETRALIASYPNLVLNSNILSNEYKTINIAEAESTKFSVEIVSSSAIGTPNLQIYLNNTLLYDVPFSSSSRIYYNFSKNDLVNYGSVLRVSCRFNGVMFWTSQQCGLSGLNIYYSVYYPDKVNDSETFYLSPLGKNAQLVELSLLPSKTTNYPVSLYINDNRIYSGVLKQNERVTLSLEGEDLGLDIENEIKLSANPGAEYTLSEIIMKFSSVPTGMAAKYVVFDVPERVINYDDDVFVTFNVTEIKEPGDLKIDILNTETNYLVSSADIVLGINRMSISTSDLEEYGNNLKIYSSNGRMVISDFIIEES